MCECAARTCYACTQLYRSSPGSPRKQNLHGKTTEVHAKVRGSTGRLQTRQHAERCWLEQSYCTRSTLIGGAALSRASRAAARFDRRCGARSLCPTAEREVYAMLVDMAKGVAAVRYPSLSLAQTQAVQRSLMGGRSVSVTSWPPSSTRTSVNSPVLERHRAPDRPGVRRGGTRGHPCGNHVRARLPCRGTCCRSFLFYVGFSIWMANSHFRW
jgi:hypothetical protein